MRFYTKTHKHYCGIDLHARKMRRGDVVDFVDLSEISKRSQQPLEHCRRRRLHEYDPKDGRIQGRAAGSGNPSEGREANPGKEKTVGPVRGDLARRQAHHNRRRCAGKCRPC